MPVLPTMLSPHLDSVPSHQWTPDTYFQLATGSGTNRLRLDVLYERTRADTLDLARSRPSSLEPKDLVWSGDVVCAVAWEVP
jgi:hypothetical protein